MLDLIKTNDLEFIQADDGSPVLEGYLQLSLLYESAIKSLKTKLEIIEREYDLFYGFNPIHNIDSRVKSHASIIAKMKRKNIPPTINNVRKNLKDVAGVRIVCKYITDVEIIANVLKSQTDIQLVEEKNYIDCPKQNGYRSLHLVFLVGVGLTNGSQVVPVEVQIRTIAMDFWASLEHQLRYKKDKDMSFALKLRLKACAEIANKLDEEMQSINKKLNEIK